MFSILLNLIIGLSFALGVPIGGGVLRHRDPRTTWCELVGHSFYMSAPTRTERCVDRCWDINASRSALIFILISGMLQRWSMLWKTFSRLVLGVHGTSELFLTYNLYGINHRTSTKMTPFDPYMTSDTVRMCHLQILFLCISVSMTKVIMNRPLILNS